MGVLRIMNKQGDSENYWETNGKGVYAAKAVFDNFVTQRKGLAFAIQPDGTGTQIKAFDPDAQEIIVVPQIQGG